MQQIIISGEVQGDVRVASGSSLTVESDATVQGDVYVDSGAEAVIDGEIQGDVIAAGNVKISSGATVGGEVRSS
jgi:cytoskeletal protein CcmA (bactofilin family)